MAITLALAYLAFISLGLPDTLLGVAWPSLRVAFSVSQAGLGALLTAGMCGYFLAGLGTGSLVKKLGVGPLLAASTAAAAGGLVGFATGPRFSLMLGAALVLGTGSGAIDAALNQYASRHFSVRHVNWLHACWGLGATAGPAAMTAVLARGLSFRVGYALIAAVLAAMALAFAMTRRRWQDSGPETTGPLSDRIAPAPAASPTPASAGAAAALRRKPVWLHIILFFVYTGVEASAGQWCFTVLRETRGLDIEAAGLWTTAYWGSLLVGRVALGFVVDRWGPDRLLRGATVTALLAALAFAFASGVLGYVGLVILGASLAPIYPTLMARTPQRLGPETARYAVGFQVSAATLGVAALPGAIGLLVARAGAGLVPFAVALLAVMLLVLHEALLRTTAAFPSPGSRPP
jgi:fucose permease